MVRSDSAAVGVADVRSVAAVVAGAVVNPASVAEGTVCASEVVKRGTGTIPVDELSAEVATEDADSAVSLWARALAEVPRAWDVRGAVALASVGLAVGSVDSSLVRDNGTVIAPVWLGGIGTEVVVSPSALVNPTMMPPVELGAVICSDEAPEGVAEGWMTLCGTPPDDGTPVEAAVAPEVSAMEGADAAVELASLKRLSETVGWIVLAGACPVEPSWSGAELEAGAGALVS